MKTDISKPLALASATLRSKISEGTTESRKELRSSKMKRIKVNLQKSLERTWICVERMMVLVLSTHENI